MFDLFDLFSLPLEGLPRRSRRRRDDQAALGALVLLPLLALGFLLFGGVYAYPFVSLVMLPLMCGGISLMLSWHHRTPAANAIVLAIASAGIAALLGLIVTVLAALSHLG
jgi:hypothetical protein